MFCFSTIVTVVLTDLEGTILNYYKGSHPEYISVAQSLMK